MFKFNELNLITSLNKINAYNEQQKIKEVEK